MLDDIDRILLEVSVRSKFVEAVGRLNSLAEKLDRYVDVEERRVNLGADYSEGEFDALEKVESEMEQIKRTLTIIQKSLHK